LASKLTFVRPERVIADFGWSSVVLANLGLGILLGSNLLPNEMERRTADLVLSKPVSRFEFLAGKALGLAGVLFCNAFLLGAVWWGALYQVGGVLTWVHVQAVVFVFCIALLSALVGYFFSSFSSRALSVFLALACYWVGSSLSQLKSTFPWTWNKIVVLDLYRF